MRFRAFPADELSDSAADVAWFSSEHIRAPVTVWGGVFSVLDLRLYHTYSGNPPLPRLFLLPREISLIGEIMTYLSSWEEFEKGAERLYLQDPLNVRCSYIRFLL